MTTDELVEEIFGRCRERIDRGEDVDVEAIVQAHPDLARPLRARFKAARLLDRAGAGERAERSDSAAAMRVGRSLGPYRLQSVLGAGGMGTVYLASGGDSAVSHVALKVFHPHLVARERFVARFEREAELGRRVDHPNVVRALDAGETPETDQTLRWLVMEHVEGRTLRALLAETGAQPEELVRHVGREVAKGLAAIHAAGAVHRDIKPENVIVTSDHVVKVMDLGVAHIGDAATLSETGAFVGSLRYAAPEQFGFFGACGAEEAVPRSPARAKGEAVDHRADIHALGLLLYELATGVHPFAGESFHEVVRQALDVRPRRIGELVPQVSPFLEELVAQLLEKDREKRPAGAAEVAAILAVGEASSWWRQRAAEIRRETRRPLRRIRIPRETALYGRDAELSRLRSLYERAKGSDGQVVLLEGEAGIGKSRLVDEFVGALAASGEDVNFLYGSYPPGGAATASGAFVTAYREHLGDDEAAIRAALPQTPLLAPAFAALLRGDVVPEGAEKLTKDSLQTVFLHATRTFATTRTTVVLIDDLHFAPVEGHALFASLALGVRGHRILLVGTARPEIDAAWIAQVARGEHVSRITLPRLGAKDLVLLLRDSLRSEHLAEELGAKIAVKSDGNPFFVFEILRGLRDGQFLTRKPDGTWGTTRLIAEIEVPETVKDLIFARVGSLSTAERNLLDVAACAGFDFDPVLVGEVLRLDRISALQRLAAVEKSHRLVHSSGRRFVFDHHQVAEVLYAGLPEMLREEYHAALGAAIEARSGAASKSPTDLDGALCVDLAEHFLSGGRGAQALRYLNTAIDHLAFGYRHDAALRLADRALSVPGLVHGRDRCELLLRKVGRLGVLGRREAQLAAVEEANACVGAGTAQRAWARNSLGVLFTYLLRYDEAQTALRDACALARAAGDRRCEATATGNLGMVFGYLGHLEEAQEQYLRQLALAREAGDGVEEGGAMQNLGNVLWDLCRLEDAREHYERSLAVYRTLGDRRREAIATGNLGSLLRDLDRGREARENIERSLSLARETGDRGHEAVVTGTLGNVVADLGRLGEAREHFERSLALSRETGNRWNEALVTGNLGNLFIVFGRFGEARELNERRLALHREARDRRSEFFPIHCLADIAAEEGDAAEAERRYAEVLALVREFGDRRAEAGVLVVRGIHLAWQSRHIEACADLRSALDLAREPSLPRVDVLANAQLAALPGGDVTAALAAWAAHEGRISMLDATHVRFLLWQATRDPTHLAEARRRLDLLVEHAPADCRESMITNVRLHREIAAAARDHGIA